MTNLKQYGILVMGLLIGGGFAFGGIASYAGITGGGNSNNGGEEFNTSLPAEQYSDGSYGLSAKEQLYIASQNDIVFVTGFYENSSQKQELTGLSPLPDRFNDRVYVSVVNSSEASDVFYNYGITEFPRVVVIGGNRNYRTSPLEDVSAENVGQEVCSAFSSLGSVAPQCTV